MKIIFLDIDGVLNGHEKHDNGYCGTKLECVARLNRIIRATDARIVVTSAWRYCVLRGYCNLTGLENLLLTHGVDCRNRLIGLTDWDHAANSRGELVHRWIHGYHGYIGSYVVLDDLGDESRIELYHGSGNFVRTDRQFGLTDVDECRAIRILLGEQAP